eukprot:m.169913 g.169913  ORF g.169913 m.169913 type:complete len:568 (-) comp13484_c3_seq13:221-1924(-)
MMMVIRNIFPLQTRVMLAKTQAIQGISHSRCLSSKVPLTALKESNEVMTPHYESLSDAELAAMVVNKELSQHKLEKVLQDTERAVNVRRLAIGEALVQEGRAEDAMDDLPHAAFDYKGFYDNIFGTNCEAVIGYMPVPVGVVGPLRINGVDRHVPMATTEGALLASTNRGCRAITESGGTATAILKNGMTRAPLIRVPSAAYGAEMIEWVNMKETQAELKQAFNSTTSHGKLQSVEGRLAGKNLYLRFACHCGDAMGMNMVTKGTVEALRVVKEKFSEAEMVALSGNVCSDKKAAAINWIEGRGRSVVCEVVLKRDVVERVLKTTPEAMIHVNNNKNLIGSAVAGALGGFNAHAANNVAAVFIATGNDPAQVIESSQCLTVLEMEGEDLHMSVTMPSIEVGTVGGGTTLPAQRAALKMIGCQGADRVKSGGNADILANAVASTVLAGEISLIAALTTNDLLKAHIELNRKTGPAPSSTTTTTTTTTTPPPTSDTPAFGTSGTRSLHTTTNILGHCSIGHPSSGGPSEQLDLNVTQGRPMYRMPGTCLDAADEFAECAPDGSVTYSFP